MGRPTQHTFPLSSFFGGRATRVRYAIPEPHTPPAGRGVAARDRVAAVIAAGTRPDLPFRTRKLRLPAPMVLHPPGCGRVGHRRQTTTKGGAAQRPPPFLSPATARTRLPPPPPPTRQTTRQTTTTPPDTAADNQHTARRRRGCRRAQRDPGHKHRPPNHQHTPMQ